MAQFFNCVGSPTTGYKRPDISNYRYLSLSNSTEIASVRALLNDWLSEYNLQDKDALLSKIQSHDDNAFQSAALELCVFSALRALNCEVLAAEPKGFSARKRPDYFCKKNNSTFLVEVKNLTAHSAEEAAGYRRLELLKERINATAHPEFFFNFDTRRLPETNLPVVEIMNGIRSWISNISYDEVLAAFAENSHEVDPRYEFVWPVHNPYFCLSLIPVKEECRGETPVRAIGAEMTTKWSDARERLRKALKSKSSKYGKLLLPYFIVINADDFFADTEDFYEALFGSLAVVVQRDGRNPRTIRNSDGLFGNAQSPKFTRVTGVFFVQGLNVYSLATRSVHFVPHPAAANSFFSPDFFRRFPHTGIPVRGSNHFGLAKLFGLSPGWPGVMK